MDRERYLHEVRKKMPKVEQVGEHEWEFVYSPKYEELMDKFDRGVDLWQMRRISSAKKIYKEVIVEGPGDGKVAGSKQRKEKKQIIRGVGSQQMKSTSSQVALAYNILNWFKRFLSPGEFKSKCIKWLIVSKTQNSDE